nr:unnamed protein product [Digitaria exilis]
MRSASSAAWQAATRRAPRTPPDVSLHALLPDAEPLGRQGSPEVVGARGDGVRVVEQEHLAQPRECRERRGLLLQHGFQARDELRDKSLGRARRRVLVLVFVAVAEDEAEGDAAAAKHAAEVAHPEPDAGVHLAALRYLLPRVVGAHERSEVSPAPPRAVHQAGERGLGGRRDGMGRSPGEEHREEGVRLRERGVEVECSEQLPRAAPLERRHGADQCQHRAGARGRELAQSGLLLGSELLAPEVEVEHALHGAQRLRPRADPSPELPPRDGSGTHVVEHPGDVELGEPERQRLGARGGIGGRGEGRQEEEEEHPLVVLVVKEDAHGGLVADAAVAVELVVVGGEGERGGVGAPELGLVVGIELVGAAGAVALRSGRRGRAASAAAAAVVADAGVQPGLGNDNLDARVHGARQRHGWNHGHKWAAS